MNSEKKIYIITLSLNGIGDEFHYILDCDKLKERRKDFNVGLKKLLHQGLSEPEFYGDLVYEFKRNVGRADFSDQFRKIIVRYKRIGL